MQSETRIRSNGPPELADVWTVVGVAALSGMLPSTVLSAAVAAVAAPSLGTSSLGASSSGSEPACWTSSQSHRRHSIRPPLFAPRSSASFSLRLACVSASTSPRSVATLNDAPSRCALIARYPVPEPSSITFLPATSSRWAAARNRCKKYALAHVSPPSRRPRPRF
eukprot:828600-Prymnesium_polylepis.2